MRSLWEIRNLIFCISIWDTHYRSQERCQFGKGGHKSVEFRGEIRQNIIICESLGHSWYLQLSAKSGMSVTVKKIDKKTELLDIPTFTTWRTKEPAKESKKE